MKCNKNLALIFCGFQSALAFCVCLEYVLRLLRAICDRVPIFSYFSVLKLAAPSAELG